MIIYRANVPVREIGRALRDSPQPPRRNYPRGFDGRWCAPGVASSGPSLARRPCFSNPDPPRRPEFARVSISKVRLIGTKCKNTNSDDVPRRRCRRYTVRKARSRSRCRNTATKPTSRTRVDDEPSTPRPSRCCRTSSCTRRGIRLRFRAAARDSSRTRASSRGTRTRGCRWTSVEMQVIVVLLVALT